MRRTLVAALTLAGVGACTDEVPSPAEPVTTTVAEAHYEPQPRLYEVTIKNLTEGQPFTPPVIATHSRRVRLWRVRRPAGIEVKEIAENGNLAPMLATLNEIEAVNDVVVAEGPSVPPLLPGEKLEALVEGSRRARFFSVVSMLICTNDGFTGISRRGLPVAVGQVRRWNLWGFDAGTEINTEDFADIVPPCPALTGVESDDPGAGASNPELAQNGVVRYHRGVRGIDDLVPEIHDWQGPVGRLEIRRVR